MQSRQPNKFSSVQRTNYTAIESMIINQNGCCSFHYRNVCLFAFYMRALMPVLVLCTRVRNELAINFSYRRIRLGWLGCVCVHECVLELLYKLINRTLGTSAASTINENEMAWRGRLLLWFFFCRLQSDASSVPCDTESVEGKKVKWNEFIARMLCDSMTERCRTPLRARLHGEFYIFTLQKVPRMGSFNRSKWDTWAHTWNGNLTWGHSSHRIWSVAV